jgi:hypothetical protein
MVLVIDFVENYRFDVQNKVQSYALAQLLGDNFGTRYLATKLESRST